MENLRHIGMSVSYTHLDVYKRQLVRVSSGALVAREMYESLGTEAKYPEVRYREKREIFFEREKNPVSDPRSSEKYFKIQYFYRNEDTISNQSEQLCKPT